MVPAFYGRRLGLTVIYSFETKNELRAPSPEVENRRP